MNTTHAIIDIGTNSVLLLIAEVGRDGAIKSVLEDRADISRLGEGLQLTGRLSDEGINRTINVLKNYITVCQQHGVTNIKAVGTAALRRASNSSQFFLAANSLNINIDIISEGLEAELSFEACTKDFGNEIVVMDIGGGSTEFVTKDKQGGLHLKSVPIGSVTLTESFLKTDPPTGDEILSLRNHIRTMLESLIIPEIYSRPNDRELVATAGTSTTLMSMHLGLPKYEPEKVHAMSLRIEHLRDMIEMLSTTKNAHRKNIVGLDPKRSDVILGGAYLLYEAMSLLGYASVIISDRGLRYGLLYRTAKGSYS